MYVLLLQFKYQLSLFYLNLCSQVSSIYFVYLCSTLWNTGPYLLWAQHQSWNQSPFKLHPLLTNTDQHRSSLTSPIQLQSTFRHDLNMVSKHNQMESQCQDCLLINPKYHLGAVLKITFWTIVHVGRGNGGKGNVIGKCRRDTGAVLLMAVYKWWRNLCYWWYKRSTAINM